jgi:hypothetical protein
MQSGSARSRGLAACLAAMLCAGCAPGPAWFRPPKPRADATIPAAPGVARNAANEPNAAGSDKIRITTLEMAAQAACPM